MASRIFVYGTLRKLGSASHLMQSAQLVEENVKIAGIKIFDQGSYPVALDGFDLQAKVSGDIYMVDDALIKILDRYEGDEYYRCKLSEVDTWIYLGKNRLQVLKLPLIKSGDWLNYRCNYY
ncbi:MAG: gamma-glutamylcyclotransferase family protein [Cyclobacteriaceae bacterium]